MTIDGETFDSKKEYRRYCGLKLLEMAGEIINLEKQVKFILIPTQYETFERYGKKGKRLKDGQRLLEKECAYIADFVYRDCKTGKLVVEDVKSEATRKKESYIIKRKLMLKELGIKISEI